MREVYIIAAALLAVGSSTAAAADQPICPDRPSKSRGPCTVPPGKWQVETGLVDWSSDRTDGITTEMTMWGNTSLKYDLTGNTDLELWLTPLDTLHVHRGGACAHCSSFGDTLVRVKYEVTSESSPMQVALDPFVKIPTANHRLGNGKAEGGFLLPVQIAVGKTPLTISFDPELDWLADQDDSGRHAALVPDVNLGWQASQKLTLTTEIWSQWDWDPSAPGKQLSCDLSSAYLPRGNLQLDAGVNFGLNRHTPDVELYTGVSVRF